MDQLTEWFTQHFAQQYVVLVTLLVTATLLIAASIIILVVNRLLAHWLTRVETRLHIPYETVLIANRTVCGTLWVITALLVLEIWGIGMNGVWTLMVSVATIIGVGFLATWTLISNFTASFFIAVWRPFHLGQVVEILPERLKGRVIDRNLMFTALREESGSVIEVPNNLFFQKTFRVIDRREKSPFELLETIASSGYRTRAKTDLKAT
jgi:small-conductance mechanosensitive channel